jgi:DNA-binding response OmpR family regulator
VERLRYAAPKPTVLIVEDDLDTLNYMRTVLQRRYRVLSACTAEEARTQFRLHASELAIVLMDLSLKGGEDGLSLTRWLRQQVDRVKLPVLATTAHAFADDKSKALAAGCTGYLAKPFLHYELLAAVDACFNRGTPEIAAFGR